jgi:methylated-DNA-[protein]-cysteine S-methyltransferase
MSGYSIFETAIGTCGIAWGDAGVLGVQLPESTPDDTRRRLARRFPASSESTPPPELARAIADITSLLAGKSTSLKEIAVDMSRVAEFERLVYSAAREIPPGATFTYGEIARRIGHPGAAREVGAALARNPFAIVVPCHRVVAANGKTGGFSAGGGVATKLRLLAIESAGGSGPLFEQV